MRLLHTPLVVGTALGLAPPIATPAINPPRPALSIFNVSHADPFPPSTSNLPNGTNADHTLSLGDSDDDVRLLNQTNDVARCDGARYGVDLDKKSCLDTWRSIPTDDEFVTYGARSKGSFQAPLPVRFLSRKSPTAKSHRYGCEGSVCRLTFCRSRRCVRH